jgi:hypothetical protein
MHVTVCLGSEFRVRLLTGIHFSLASFFSLSVCHSQQLAQGEYLRPESVHNTTLINKEIGHCRAMRRSAAQLQPSSHF